MATYGMNSLTRHSRSVAQLTAAIQVLTEGNLPSAICGRLPPLYCFYGAYYMKNDGKPPLQCLF